MIYLPDQNAAFLHVPKVAGTWLRRVLIELVPGAQVAGYEHADRAQAVEEFGRGIRTFCFVRHPLTWYQSFWAHRELTGWGGDFAIAHACKSHDFNSFALCCAAKYPGFLADMYARFTDSAEYVQRYERLHVGIGLILGALGVDASPEAIAAIPHENRGASLPGLARRAIYTPAARAAILESERTILESYGYDDDWA
jgi:hypothetical protein